MNQGWDINRKQRQIMKQKIYINTAEELKVAYENGTSIQKQKLARLYMSDVSIEDYLHISEQMAAGTLYYEKEFPPLTLLELVQELIAGRSVSFYSGLDKEFMESNMNRGYALETISCRFDNYEFYRTGDVTATAKEEAG